MKKLYDIVLLSILLTGSSALLYYCTPNRHNINPVRTTLLSVNRTMKGYKHIFITDNGDSLVRYYNDKLLAGECYYIK